MKCVDCMYFTRQNGDNGYCSEFVQPVNVRCGCEIDKVKDARKEPRPDLVEVVRCKDCIFSKRDMVVHPDPKILNKDRWCELYGRKSPDWFCADGERRDNGTTN